MKQRRHIALSYGLGALAILIVIAVLAIAVAFQINKSPATTKPTGSLLSFDTTPLWVQGPTGKKSMTLFHDSHACFILVNYKTGHVDAAAQIRETQKGWQDDKYSVTPRSPKTLDIQTGTGKRDYKLYQFVVAAPPASDKMKVASGQEFGFVQLKKGHLRIEGYCDTADQLSVTIPALQAIEFNEK